MRKIVFFKKGNSLTTSRLIAEKFGKEHKHVLDAIRNLDCSEEFSRSNFWLSNFESRGKEYPEYYITRDGFTFLLAFRSYHRTISFDITYIQYIFAVIIPATPLTQAQLGGFFFAHEILQARIIDN